MNSLSLLQAGTAALLLLFTLLWLIPEQGNALLWAMQGLPLLCTIPGLRQGNRRALQWLGFLLLFYLVNGILQAFNPAPILRMLGTALAVISLAMFVLVLLILKVPSRQHRGD